MSKSIMVGLLLGLLSGSCGGTSGVSLHATPTNIPLVTRNYKIIAHGLRADVCKSVFFGFGIDDTSYAKAIKKIHEQVPTGIGQDYQLVNVVEDKTFEFYLFGGKKCTVISADVAVLLEPVAAPMVKGDDPRAARGKRPAEEMVKKVEHESPLAETASVPKPADDAGTKAEKKKDVKKNEKKELMLER